VNLQFGNSRFGFEGANRPKGRTASHKTQLANFKLQITNQPWPSHLRSGHDLSSHTVARQRGALTRFPTREPMVKERGYHMEIDDW
jgi:hypothetical protein